MIQRTAEKEVRNLARQFKAVAIVGPRQSGKTTLAKYVFNEKAYANLENPDTRRFALNDPRGFLAQFPDGAILDEAQRVPELFSYLQQVLDDYPTPGMFILSGSNHFLLQENISQSLAGRIAYLNLLPLSVSELIGQSIPPLNEILFKGFYPILFDQPVDPNTWFANYIRTYVERDIRQIKNITNLDAFERVIRLCAGRVGQLINFQNLAIEAGVDGKTIASWIGILESSFIIHRLYPYYKNFKKRIVKTPKLYFYDTGLVCALLGIQKAEQLEFHPIKGALFENMIVSELMKGRFNKGLRSNLYFWRDNTGYEIDIILEESNGLYPVEIKSGKTITSDYFKGLHFWQKISGNSEGAIIYGGGGFQKRSDGIHVISWNRMDMDHRICPNRN